MARKKTEDLSLDAIETHWGTLLDMYLFHDSAACCCPRGLLAVR